MKLDGITACCLIVGLLCSLVATSCSEQDQPQTFRQFNELVVVSAVPMKEVTEGGEVTYVPLCRMQDEAADGMILRVLLEGTISKDGGDLDRSIRPGDKVRMKTLSESNITPARFDLFLSCIEQDLPGAAQCKTSSDCAKGGTCDPRPGKGFCVDEVEDCYSGVQTGNVLISHIGYEAHTPSRKENIGVAILVDMSGSNKGFVKPYPPYYEVDNWDPSGVHEDALTDFAQRASDINGSRMDAVKTIIENLNDDDKFIVFGFREYGIDVVCELPGRQDADNDEKRNECYSSSRYLLMGDGSFGSLDEFKTEVGGRSPLWTAVELAYDYMESHPATQSTDHKHIVVITDGPDTCSESSSLDQCSGACVQYSTSFETVVDRVEQEDYEDRIPIHFIQYQAKGYLDRDPRQQEIACLTGGHHLFINSQEFQTQDLSYAFEDAARRLRFTFGGHWEFAIEAMLFGENNSLSDGWNYGIGGMGKVLYLDDGVLVQSERPFTFDIDDDWLDRRVSFRKDCRSDGDCPMAEDDGPCTTRVWWCDDQALVCTGAQEWAENGTGGGDCGDVDAVVRVQVRDLMGGTGTETNVIKLGDLPASCCSGACTPPMPPVVPEDLARGGGTICFEYDVEKGWSYDEDEEEWVYWAELYIQGGCPSWNKIKPAIAFGVNDNPSIGDLNWDEHWDCPERSNCFPPEGEI